MEHVNDIIINYKDYSQLEQPDNQNPLVSGSIVGPDLSAIQSVMNLTIPIIQLVKLFHTHSLANTEHVFILIDTRSSEDMLSITYTIRGVGSRNIGPVL